MAMDLAGDGACHLPGAAAALLPALDAMAERLARDRAGQRLEGDATVRALTASGAPLQQVAAGRLGAGARAVRALFFNKSDGANWTLGWHQDRTIAVTARHEVAGFGPWTVKAGMLHVAPPYAILSAMLTMRVHLDDVPPDNAPLLVAPASHGLGVIAERDMAAIVARCGMVACTAKRGDIWLYATPILHASERARPGLQRRVLQLDFAAQALPEPLEWRGI